MESPPLMGLQSRCLPNRLNPKPQPVGMTEPMAPDPAFGALRLQTAAPLENPWGPIRLNMKFGMPWGIPASRFSQLAG
jgi:hypothetical protein